MTIGESIKHARKKAGHKQKDFADILGITASHLCRIEHGEIRPTDDNMQRIANILGKEWDHRLKNAI